MSRFIDAEYDLHNLSFYYDFSDEELSAIHSAMRSIPTADVVEVIPCKNCFYSKPYNAVWYLPLKENNLWCSRYEEEKEPNWFCADAIRREQ